MASLRNILRKSSDRRNEEKSLLKFVWTICEMFVKCWSLSKGERWSIEDHQGLLSFCKLFMFSACPQNCESLSAQSQAGLDQKLFLQTPVPDPLAYWFLEGYKEKSYTIMLGVTFPYSLLRISKAESNLIVDVEHPTED